MGELVIKNGQFYRDGKVVPPVFGDTEQIACLKRQEQLVFEAREFGVAIEYQGEDDDNEDLVVSQFEMLIVY